MRTKGAIVLVGLIVIAGGWWVLRGNSRAEPEEGVLDVWAMWSKDRGSLQALLDRYSQASGLPVKVRAGVNSDRLLRALAGPAPPDVVVLSSGDLVGSYDAQGLIEPLDAWIEETGIDLSDMYPAPLAQCETPDGRTLCLPWGCDVHALFWNKALFAAADLDPERAPQTMEELVAYADRLTARDEEGKLGQMGFIPDYPRPHTDLYARMFGGSWYSDDGAELTVDSQAVVDAENWQLQFYSTYGSEEVVEFASSMNRYTSSRHPVYAGRRLDCQQCHRSAPPGKGDKIPDHGFYGGKVAMMVGGEWQVGPGYIAQFQPALNYGVAPFPPPADHPERANTAVVEGAVVIIPARSVDKEAAAELLAWMTSPEIVAEAAYASAALPTSRTAARDPRFQQMPHFGTFMDLLANPNAGYVATTPISGELNQALGEVEENVLHEGGDPTSLLGKVQAELAPKLRGGLAYHEGP